MKLISLIALCFALVLISALAHSQEVRPGSRQEKSAPQRDEASSAELKERDELLAKAEASLKAAAANVKDDPTRPVYHVLAPANWINDPNGPIYHEGYYHLFYQHNPYGDQWGNMHWGHVRSPDLVHWEHLPIALWPSKSKGEEHCFSGCATVTKCGELMLFYTSIGKRAPEQWAAVPEDRELIKWKKHSRNPLLTEKLHGDTRVYEWRDPFVFHHGEKTYLVCGGNLNNSAGGQAAVLVYRAENDELTEWTYLGVLFQHPDAAVKNIECPLFFPLADRSGNKRWVLIISPHGPVQYFVGDLDAEAMTFKSETRGIVDHGSFYAPNVMFDKAGRCLLWGWIRDFPPGKGWNGCLTVPRVLSLGKDGHLQQQPAAEVDKLETDNGLKSKGRDFDQALRSIFTSDTKAYRLRCTIDRGDETEIVIAIPRGGDDKQPTTIRYKGRELDIAGTKAPLALIPGEPLRLDVLVDHSVLEVYANGRACVSRVIPVADTGVSISIHDGVGKFTYWDTRPMGPIWAKPD